VAQSKHPGVRKDEDGAWWVDFRWEGQRIRRRVDEDGAQLRDREHAERLRRALLHKLETGQAITAPRRGMRPRATVFDVGADWYTVGEACLAYLDLSARKSAFTDIERSCRLWIQLFGEKPIDELTSLDVELAMEKRAAASSNSTANRDLTYLRAAIRKAVAAGKAQRDPTAPIKKLAEPPHRKRWLRPKEGVDLWPHLTDPQDRRLVLVIVNTGLRRGNACAMEWAWVDWENEMLDVPMTKSGDSQTVPLNSVSMAALREQYTQTSHSRWVWLGKRGATTVVQTNWLRSGNTRSCGCLQRESKAANLGAYGQPAAPEWMVGRTYRQWTILRVVGYRETRVRGRRRAHRLYVVACRCSCGTEREVLAGSILMGKSHSCGCKRLGRPMRGPWSSKRMVRFRVVKTEPTMDRAAFRARWDRLFKMEVEA